MKKKTIIFTTVIMALFFISAGKMTVEAIDFEPNKVLGSTNWEGIYVYNAQGNDVTEKIMGLLDERNMTQKQTVMNFLIR